MNNMTDIRALLRRICEIHEPDEGIGAQIANETYLITWRNIGELLDYTDNLETALDAVQRDNQHLRTELETVTGRLQDVEAHVGQCEAALAWFGFFVQPAPEDGYFFSLHKYQSGDTGYDALMLAHDCVVQKIKAKKASKE